MLADALWFWIKVMFCIGVGYFLLTGLGSAIDNYTIRKNAECVAKFGEGWEFRNGDRSPDVCIDKEGNAKYL